MVLLEYDIINYDEIMKGTVIIMRNINVMKLFELRKDAGAYKMVLYDALPTGDLVMDIDEKEYDRLYNRYNYFLEDDKKDVKVFSQNFLDKSNSLFYFRKLFADEFAKYFA